MKRVLAIGTLSSNLYIQRHQIHDAKEIVIDEVLGQWMVWTYGYLVHCDYVCSQQNLIVVIVGGFVLFRFFDILKPWPIRWCDKHIKGGILIDVMACAAIPSFRPVKPSVSVVVPLMLTICSSILSVDAIICFIFSR